MSLKEAEGIAEMEMPADKVIRVTEETRQGLRDRFQGFKDSYDKVIQRLLVATRKEKKE